MKRRTKNKILKTITAVAMTVNVLYFAFIVWFETADIGAWSIPWALANIWIILFVFSNIDTNWLNTNKRKR
jgi:succinate dehydrogenase hydrophobic anchor subunit